MVDILSYLAQQGRKAADAQSIQRKTGSWSAADGFLGLGSNALGHRTDVEKSLSKGEITTPDSGWKLPY